MKLNQVWSHLVYLHAGLCRLKTLLSLQDCRAVFSKLFHDKSMYTCPGKYWTETSIRVSYQRGAPIFNAIIRIFYIHEPEINVTREPLTGESSEIMTTSAELDLSRGRFVVPHEEEKRPIVERTVNISPSRRRVLSSARDHVGRLGLFWRVDVSPHAGMCKNFLDLFFFSSKSPPATWESFDQTCACVEWR